MEQRKPIKRSEQLAPLSREHHEGLLLSWKVRQGLKKGIDAKRIGAYVQWFREAHLRQHFALEEQVLASRLPQENALVMRMFDEHQEIEALLQINENIADPGLLEQIAQALDDHIRFEERELFPYAEAALSGETLDEIQKALSAEKSACTPWKDEFWSNTGSSTP